jgi:hypothetical protein
MSVIFSYGKAQCVKDTIVFSYGKSIANIVYTPLFSFEEFIFDGVSESPNVAYQNLDMHSFYDGQYIWYPASNNNALTNSILRYDPSNDSLIAYALASYGGDSFPQVYQAIQDINDDNVV